MTGNGAESVSRALKPIDEVRHALDKMAPQFKLALPPHIPVERFVRIVQTAVASNTDLLECNRQSLYGAAMRCAQDGLLPDGHEAAIAKFGQAAQYMPMVKGILKKVRNSGELNTINAHVVRENDKYRSWVDRDGEHFEHEKARGDRGAPIYTYAYAITKDGGFYFEELTEDDIQAIRKVSRAANNGPWAGAFADEMRRKSAIRRLSKRLPMSTDIEEFMRRDDDLFMPPEQQPEMKDISPAPATASDDSQATKPKRPRALDKVAKAGQAQDVEAKPQGETVDSQTGEITSNQQSGGPTDVI